MDLQFIRLIRLKLQMALNIYTPNLELRQMLWELTDTRRVTDSGFDIPMLHEEIAMDVDLYTFNLHIKVAATYEGITMPCILIPRSSISGTVFRLANSIGLIDAGYRGEVKAKVDVFETESPPTIQKGTRLFQICQHNFLPWREVNIVQFEDDLPQARDNRGEGGFGSTG